MAVTNNMSDKQENLDNQEQGRALRRLLKNKDVSVSQASRDLGVERQTIHNWLNGSPIPDKTASQVAEYLKCSVVELKYGQPFYNAEDMAMIIELTENIIVQGRHQIKLKKKAKMIALIYEEYQEWKGMFPASDLRSEMKKKIELKLWLIDDQ